MVSLKTALSSAEEADCFAAHQRATLCRLELGKRKSNVLECKFPF